MTMSKVRLNCEDGRAGNGRAPEAGIRAVVGNVLLGACMAVLAMLYFAW